MILRNSTLLPFLGFPFLGSIASLAAFLGSFASFLGVTTLTLPQVYGNEVDFNRDVRPILSDKCFVCHGPDGAQRKADLRLDRREQLISRGILVPGDVDASTLIQRIDSSDPNKRMPPLHSKLTLNEKERETLRLWVEQGGTYQPHWSFVPLPMEVPIPSVDNTTDNAPHSAAWPRNEIDHFILAQMGRKPSPEASAERWLRRVSFDLTGLPPSTEEIHEFTSTSTEDPYERAVDRLLDSSAFGERMAVPWLDAARYADSYGYQSDLLVHSWPYRDWVVRSFNENLPYDKFITHQLAGDLLPNPTRDQVLATSFNRLHRMTNEGGSISEEWLNEYVADRVHTFGTAFLGLTLECARCHDHKYDPISQREYYQLYAYFNSIDEHGMYHDTSRVPTPSLLLPTEEQERHLQQLEGDIGSHQEILRRVQSGAQPIFEHWVKAPEFALPQPVGHYTFDSLDDDGSIRNLVNTSHPAKTSPVENKLVEGQAGKALEFSGDDAAQFSGLGDFPLSHAFTIEMRLWIPSDLEKAIIFHRSGGTDVGYHGLECSILNNRILCSFTRAWPGNAMAVQSQSFIPKERWVHLCATYDGSVQAKGLKLYIDGEVTTEILRDSLTKLPGHGGDGLTVGERFRDSGLRGARLDELRVFDKALVSLEVRRLFDEDAFENALLAQDLGGLREYFDARVDGPTQSARDSLHKARFRLLEAQTPIQEISVMRELDHPLPAYILRRGEYDAPLDDDSRVKRNTPQALPSSEGFEKSRLGLAHWLLEPDHPLTSRVAVNRIWQIFFGKGLVPTSDNFGWQGQPPTHPRLLDWLASDFVQSGWNLKKLVKKIALSSTYRQDSAIERDFQEIDRDNSSYARGPSRRLPAEMIRDTALFTSGLMDSTLGGPPVSPYQPPNLWRESNTMSPAYNQSVGKALYRRSIYSVWKRTAPMPNMVAFDAPTREVCRVTRMRTNTPLQALVLLNDKQFIESSRALAQRVIQEESEVHKQIQSACIRLTGRRADSFEIELLESLYRDELQRFSRFPDDVVAFLSIGDAPFDPNLEPSQLAAMTIVTQALLNLDATIWER